MGYPSSVSPPLHFLLPSEEKEEPSPPPRMACCEAHSWTLPALAVAFLDLAVASLLLAAATIAYLLSAFLSLLGLRLPCPAPAAALASDPAATASSLVSASLSRFPFRDCRAGVSGGEALGREGLQADEGPLSRRELGSSGFGSFSSSSSASTSSSGGGKLWRERIALRRHRRAEKVKSMSPLEVPPHWGMQMKSGSPSPCSNKECKSEVNELNAGGDAISDVGLSWEVEKYKSMGGVGVDGVDGSRDDTIRVLEHALEEEQAARCILYLELEKERNASATAAEEAMAMIERLQKEKASTEMNARQYQRMIEEKTAYEEEEMEILKEIVMRREKELYMLEKELDMYRHMMLSGEVSGQQVSDKNQEMVDASIQMPHSSFGSDPALLLKNFCDPQKKNDVKGLTNEDTENKYVGHVKALFPLGWSEETSFREHKKFEGADNIDSSHPEVLCHVAVDPWDFEEKDVISIDAYASGSQIPIVRAEGGSISKLYSLSQPMECCGGSYSKCEISHPCGEVNDNIGQYDTLDVHAIDDLASCREEFGGETAAPIDTVSVHTPTFDAPIAPNGIRNLGIFSNSSSVSSARIEADMHRSVSDCLGICQSLDSSLARVASSFHPRRNSISVVDCERSKIETEVEGLRRRLTITRQEREKLSRSVDRVQKEDIQLQLLEEITLHLKEIRQLAKPGKAMCEGSLPPPSSKVNLKTQRCRSALLEFEEPPE